MKEKEILTRVAQTLGTKNPVRDDCGDWKIEGKRGDIHLDGLTALSVWVRFPHKKACSDAQNELGKPKQSGDREAVWKIEIGSLSPILALSLKKHLKLPKKTVFSPEALAKRKLQCEAMRAAKAVRP